MLRIIKCMSRILLLIVLLNGIFGAIKAQHSGNLFRELDEVISKKDVYHRRVQNKIDSLKTILKTSDEESVYDVYTQIYECYNNFQIDSALHYIRLIKALPVMKRNNEKRILSDLRLSITYGLIGDFYTAMQIVDSINVSDASKDIRSEYFHTCRTLYGWYSEYVEDFHRDNNKYVSLTQSFRDSILVYTEPGIRRCNVLADNFIVHGEADAAIDILQDIIAKANDEQKIYAYYNLAQCYKAKHDEDKYARYLALTAISDLENGVTEYIALPELANLMLKKGDIDRAYNYLFCSMEDAHFCNSALRTIEVNTIFPIIDKEYREQQRKTQNFEHLILTGLSVFAIILIVALFYLQKQMRRTRTMKEKLSETNIRLAEANNRLEEANAQLEVFNLQLGENNDLLSKENNVLQSTNKIKEEYIAHYLEMCRSYMDTFENFRRSLLKMAKNNQQQDMLKFLKSDDVIEEEQKRFFVDFDKSFLSIHPDFISEFNALLREDSQLVPKKGELLNTELRIFALIRLGVDDSSIIAHFLNYSMPTIYNYRSRVRNSSIYEKDEFMKRLMEIS